MHVEVCAGVFDQVEAQARLQAHVIALDLGDARIVAQGGETGAGEGEADFVALVAAGVVEALVVVGLVLQVAGVELLLQVVGRVGEGVVALHLAGRAHLLAVVQAAQAGAGLVAAAVGVVEHGQRVGVVVVNEAFVVVIVLGLDQAGADHA